MTKPDFPGWPALVFFGLALVSCSALPASAQEIIATPGYTWGEARSPASQQPEEKDSDIFEGAIHQGVDWLQLGRGVRLNNFVEFGFKTDSEEIDYNNELEPAVGIQLRFFPADWAWATAGAKYSWVRRFETDRDDSGPIFFITWGASKSWPAAQPAGGGRPWPLGYSFFTWGEARYPSSLVEEEEDNGIIEGALELAADVWKPDSFMVVSPFVELGYKADTDELEYNNEIEPGVGARLRFLLSERAHIDIGAKFSDEIRFSSGRSHSGMTYFLRWAASW